MALGFVGCEPWPEVNFANETQVDVLVYQGGQLVYTLAPGETVEQDTTDEDWVGDIRVTTRNGKVLLDEIITYNDLGNRDFKIIISCESADESPC